MTDTIAWSRRRQHADDARRRAGSPPGPQLCSRSVPTRVHRSSRRRIGRCEDRATWSGRAMRAPPDRATKPARRFAACEKSRISGRSDGEAQSSISGDRGGGTDSVIGRRSGRELRAALASTAVDDRAAGASAHAQPESMHARTTTVVRLEGPLALGHGDSLCSVRGCPPRVRTHGFLVGRLIRERCRTRVGGISRLTSTEPGKAPRGHRANPQPG